LGGATDAASGAKSLLAGQHWRALSCTARRPAFMPITCKFPTLFRTEADAHQYFPLMILAHVLLSGALGCIYARGAEAQPWKAQGVRFGIAIALLTSVPTYMIYFVVQPMPGNVVIRQIVYDGVLMIILGIIVAWVYSGAAESV